MAEDPKAALERKAAELRARREAGTQADHASQKAFADARAAEMKSVSVWRVRKSVARPWTLFFGACGLLFAGMYAAVPDDDALVVLLFAIGCVVLGLWFATGLVRWRMWRDRLPFRVEGDMTALGLGAAVKTADVTVQFRGGAIPAEQLAELLHARAPESVVLPVSPTTLVINSPELEREGSNWPLAGWFRNVGRVLAEVHVAYPVESASLRPLKTDEFYVPSGGD